MSDTPAEAPAPAPLARLYARFPALQLAQDLERRKEIKAYVDGVGRRNAQETRTFLSDLLAQITRHQQAHTEDARLLTARAVAAEAQVADTARELSYEQQMRQQTEAAMITLVEQVAGLKVELGEQEVLKLELLKENQQRGSQLFTALSCLAAMWNQYCPPPTEKYPSPGHGFMSAGEEAEEVLAFWGLMRADETAIYTDHDWQDVPENVKALR